ncbi:hypothetical protein [Candidatus Avelusimicrobium luingense]|uniref:hypothetical protein n=1 Tax=Candidatus Avelusimicrobium luingense TaxID=3416211 RepID=UPI003D0F3677
MQEMLAGIGKGVNTFLKEIKTQKQTESAYRNLAQQEEYQAALVAAQAQQQNGYLLQSAAEKARKNYRDFFQTQGTQNANFAVAGLDASSATVQYILKNSRFQALLDEQIIAEDLQTQVAQNNEQAVAQVRALKQAAYQNRKAANSGATSWSIGSALSKFLGGF